MTKIFKGFEPQGSPAQILKTHDNGITATAPDGAIWMATGDGFVGLTKYPTIIWRLAPGDDPMIESNWKFQRHYQGKCYGLGFVGDTLCLLISDEGSMWVGTQNCRILNYSTGKRSETLQSALYPDGINWFIVNHLQSGGQMMIGCLVASEKSFDSGHTPAPIWMGKPDDLSSFQKITNDVGIRGPNSDQATTLSINQVADDAWVAGLGDFKACEIFEFVSENLYGSWTLTKRSNYSPPMTSGAGKGPFTWNHLPGHWAITGTGTPDNDSVWLQKTIPIWEER